MANKQDDRTKVKVMDLVRVLWQGEWHECRVQHRKHGFSGLPVREGFYVEVSTPTEMWIKLYLEDADEVQIIQPFSLG